MPGGEQNYDQGDPQPGQDDACDGHALARPARLADVGERGDYEADAHQRRHAEEPADAGDQGRDGQTARPALLDVAVRVVGRIRIPALDRIRHLLVPARLWRRARRELPLRRVRTIGRVTVWAARDPRLRGRTGWRGGLRHG